MPGFRISGQEPGQAPRADVEFHRVHRWRIADLGIPVSSPASTSLRTVTRTAVSNPAERSRVKLYAKSLQLPSLSFEEEKINAGSLKYKFPKRAEWENVTVEFYDVYGLHQIIQDWQRKIWTPEEGLKPANDYMGRPVFELVDGQGVVLQTYTLLNAYPIKVAHGDLTYTSSEVKLLTITYSYSHAEVEITQ